MLEYVEGQSLLAHANARCLDVGARLQLMQQVLEAVQHAHNQLVLHRDLKPANILVTPKARSSCWTLALPSCSAAPRPNPPP